MEAIRRTTTVQANGELRVDRLPLPEGVVVEVLVLVQEPEVARMDPQLAPASLVSFHGRGKGQGFASAEEADRFLQTERDSWAK